MVFGALVLVLVVAFYKEFLVISFDPVLAQILRINDQTVPLSPADHAGGDGGHCAADGRRRAHGRDARHTRRDSVAADAGACPSMMAVAATIGGLSAVIGLYLSYYVSVASGAAIVLVCTAFFLLALVFAPGRGLLARRRH